VSTDGGDTGDTVTIPRSTLEELSAEVHRMRDELGSIKESLDELESSDMRAAAAMLVRADALEQDKAEAADRMREKAAELSAGDC
jgi:hypothetical protein